jgi:hypothetical protein
MPVHGLQLAVLKVEEVGTDLRAAAVTGLVRHPTERDEDHELVEGQGLVRIVTGSASTMQLARPFPNARISSLERLPKQRLGCSDLPCARAQRQFRRCLVSPNSVASTEKEKC